MDFEDIKIILIKKKLIKNNNFWLYIIKYDTFIIIFYWGFLTKKKGIYSIKTLISIFYTFVSYN